jgi:biotin operon repressor
MQIKARLRIHRDSDIRDAVRRLKDEGVELSQLVRRGFRMAIAERTIDDYKCLDRRSE